MIRLRLVAYEQKFCIQRKMWMLSTVSKYSTRSFISSCGRYELFGIVFLETLQHVWILCLSVCFFQNGKFRMRLNNAKQENKQCQTKMPTKTPTIEWLKWILCIHRETRIFFIALNAFQWKFYCICIEVKFRWLLYSFELSFTIF